MTSVIKTILSAVSGDRTESYERFEGIVRLHIRSHQNPVLTIVNDSGDPIYEEYDKGNGRVIVYRFWSSGAVKGIYHFENRLLETQESGKPACEEFHPEGTISKVTYNHRGQLHQDSDKPALYLLNRKGITTTFIFSVHGKKSREDGPAVILNRDSGLPLKCEWWISGKKIHEIEYKDEIVPDFKMNDESAGPIAWRNHRETIEGFRRT